jgi:hypothetical protein
LYRVGAARIWSGGARVEVAGPPAADAAFAAALGWELTPDGELTDGAGRTLLIDRTEPRGLRAVLTLTTKGSAPLSCAELEGR